MDSEIDLDPREQKRRRCALVLEDFAESGYAAAFGAIDDARDIGAWRGSLEAQKNAARRIAKIAMEALYVECEAMPARDIMQIYVEMGGGVPPPDDVQEDMEKQDG